MSNLASLKIDFLCGCQAGEEGTQGLRDSGHWKVPVAADGLGLRDGLEYILFHF